MSQTNATSIHGVAMSDFSLNNSTFSNCDKQKEAIELNKPTIGYEVVDTMNGLGRDEAGLVTDDLVISAALASHPCHGDFSDPLHVDLKMPSTFSTFSNMHSSGDPKTLPLTNSLQIISPDIADGHLHHITTISITTYDREEMILSTNQAETNLSAPTPNHPLALTDRQANGVIADDQDLSSSSKSDLFNRISTLASSISAGDHIQTNTKAMHSDNNPGDEIQDKIHNVKHFSQSQSICHDQMTTIRTNDTESQFSGPTMTLSIECAYDEQEPTTKSTVISDSSNGSHQINDLLHDNDVDIESLHTNTTDQPSLMDLELNNLIQSDLHSASAIQIMPNSPSRNEETSSSILYPMQIEESISTLGSVTMGHLDPVAIHSDQIVSPSIINPVNTNEINPDINSQSKAYTISSLAHHTPSDTISLNQSPTTLPLISLDQSRPSPQKIDFLLDQQMEVDILSPSHSSSRDLSYPIPCDMLSSPLSRNVKITLRNHSVTFPSSTQTNPSPKSSSDTWRHRTLISKNFPIHPNDITPRSSQPISTTESFTSSPSLGSLASRKRKLQSSSLSDIGSKEVEEPLLKRRSKEPKSNVITSGLITHESSLTTMSPTSSSFHDEPNISLQGDHFDPNLDNAIVNIIDHTSNPTISHGMPTPRRSGLEPNFMFNSEKPRRHPGQGDQMLNWKMISNDRGQLEYHQVDLSMFIPPLPSRQSTATTLVTKGYEKVGTLCLLMTQELMAHPDALLFNRPVDPILDGVPDYLNVIKHPMDLKTVRSFLKKGSANVVTLAQFVEHLDRIWSNAMLYNADATLVYEQARTMAATFKAKLIHLENEIFLRLTNGGTSSPKPLFLTSDIASSSLQRDSTSSPLSDHLKQIPRSVGHRHSLESITQSTSIVTIDSSDKNHLKDRFPSSITSRSSTSAASSSIPSGNHPLRNTTPRGRVGTRSNHASDSRRVELESKLKKLRETLKRAEQHLIQINKNGLQTLIQSKLHALSSPSSQESNPSSISTNVPNSSAETNESLPPMTWLDKGALARVLAQLQGKQIALAVEAVEKDAPTLIPPHGHELTLNLDQMPSHLLHTLVNLIQTAMPEGRRWLEEARAQVSAAASTRPSFETVNIFSQPNAAMTTPSSPSPRPTAKLPMQIGDISIHSNAIDSMNPVPILSSSDLVQPNTLDSASTNAMMAMTAPQSTSYPLHPSSHPSNPAMLASSLHTHLAQPSDEATSSSDSDDDSDSSETDDSEESSDETFPPSHHHPSPPSQTPHYNHLMPSLSISPQLVPVNSCTSLHPSSPLVLQNVDSWQQLDLTSNVNNQSSTATSVSTHSFNSHNANELSSLNGASTSLHTSQSPFPSMISSSLAEHPVQIHLDISSTHVNINNSSPNGYPSHYSSTSQDHLVQSSSSSSIHGSPMTNLAIATSTDASSSMVTDDVIWSQLRHRGLLNKQRQMECDELKARQLQDKEERVRMTQHDVHQPAPNVTERTEELQLLQEAEKQRQESELEARRQAERNRLQNTGETLDLMAQSTIMRSFEQEMHRSLHYSHHYGISPCSSAAVSSHHSQHAANTP